MNKKILLSLCVIAAATALAIGGTIAYFSDTETSSGNTFTAGNLDLIFEKGSIDNWVPVNGGVLFEGGTSFTLDDLKPGDTEEKTVRLWVDDNHACGFVEVNVYEDKNNTCTEPEGIAEGTPCTDDGELNDEINFIIWKDNGIGGGGVACDNIKNGDEAIVVTGPITSTGAVPYGIGAIPNHVEEAICYGIAYCFGTWKDDGTCDGSAVGNKSQTDSFKADLIIKAEQYRNQWGAESTYESHDQNLCPIGNDYQRPV